MKCIYCGWKNAKGVSFCARCGKKIEGASKNINISPLDAIQKKKNRKKKIYILYQILISFLISAITVSFFAFPSGIIVKTAGDSLESAGFSLWHGILYLIKGYGRYNATMLSIIIGFGTLLFTFAVPIFQFFTVIAIILKKSQKGIRKISVIMTSIALVLECTMVPLAYAFIPSFKAIYARETNILPSDITGIVSWWSIVMAILVIGLMIVSSVITHKKNTV